MDTITIHAVEVWAHHGVLPEERASGQPFVVDVAVHLDLAPASASDDLGDTIDYAALAGEVAAAAGDPACQLIEAVAGRVADAVLAHEQVEAVDVTVVKPHAPIPTPTGGVSVTVHRRRER